MTGYGFADDQRPPVDKLRALLVDQHGSISDFEWIRDIVETSLDEYVDEHIEQGFNAERYAPLAIEDNLAECARLIDVCLVQRGEIFQLESQGILSALELTYAAELLAKESTLGAVAAEAAIQQAQWANAADVRAAHDEKHRIRALEVQERLALHGRAGSALNYGERVRFLRRIFTENLQRVNECMWALSFGLSAAYDLTVDSAYDYRKRAPGVSILDNGVTWVRRAIDLLELRTQKMIEREVWVFPELRRSRDGKTGSAVFTLESYVTDADVAVVSAIDVFACYKQHTLSALEESIRSHANHALGNDYLIYMQNVIQQRRSQNAFGVTVQGAGLEVKREGRRMAFRAAMHQTVRPWVETTDVEARLSGPGGPFHNAPALHVTYGDSSFPVQFTIETGETFVSHLGTGPFARLMDGDKSANEIFAPLTAIKEFAVRLRIRLLPRGG
jgi:hypothetical protein